MDIPEVGRIVPIVDPQGAAISAFQPAADPPSLGRVFLWDELMAPPPGTPGPARWVPYLATADVDATGSRGAELGGTAIVPPTDVPDTGRIAMLVDPSGATFGLLAPAMAA